MNNEHGLERNQLKGKQGDCLNAVLSACGFNLRKLIRAFSCLFRLWLKNRVLYLEQLSWIFAYQLQAVK